MQPTHMTRKGYGERVTLVYPFPYAFYVSLSNTERHTHLYFPYRIVLQQQFTCYTVTYTSIYQLHIKSSLWLHLSRYMRQQHGLLVQLYAS